MQICLQVLESSQGKIQAVLALQRHVNGALGELCNLLQGAERASHLPAKLLQMAKEHVKHFARLGEIAQAATGDAPVAANRFPAVLGAVARKLRVDIPNGKSLERFSEEQVQERLQKAGVHHLYPQSW
jgi:hypothetical protein